MRCEGNGCTKKAKLKLSQPSGWIRHWCYGHTMRNVKGLLRNVVKWNNGLYIQKVIEE